MSVMIGYFTETVTESLSHFTNIFFFLLDIVHCSNCQHDNMLFVCLCTFPISFSMILDYGDTKTGLRSSWHTIRGGKASAINLQYDYVHIRILDHVVDRMHAHAAAQWVCARSGHFQLCACHLLSSSHWWYGYATLPGHLRGEGRPRPFPWKCRGNRPDCTGWVTHNAFVPCPHTLNSTRR